MRDKKNITAVIPAAGLSRRLKPLTDHTPKCLLDIEGKSLLQRMIDSILDNGVEKFILVTGYRNEMIENFVRHNYESIDFTFINNPDFENNNNSYSLWLASEFVKGDMLLLDSDIFFESGIITSMISSHKENIIAVNFTDELDEEQVKVELDNEKKLLYIGKDTPIEKSAGESIGIALFSSYFLKTLFGILNRKIKDEKNVNEFYELSFQEAIEDDDKRNCIYAIDISKYNCMEIDTPADLESARELARNYKL